MMTGVNGETGGGARDALHALCLADPVWSERYEGWTELGRGGSAAVVRTFSRDAGGDVALKIFYGLAAEDRVRFEREVRGAQRLASPHIVRTFSPFARGSLAWIEMEWVDGGDLRQELGRRAATARPFSVPEACGVGACVAQALVTAHAADVVHRDVKPANVLLPRDGAPAAKLSDFGISRILGATRVTATGLLAGTPQFAAPEIVAGAESGPAADVYSLALCAYLMLSGNRFPYDLPEGATVAQWLRAHADAVPRSIRSVAGAIPSDVAMLIMAGLAKDPSGRPTAEQFHAGLRAWSGGPATPKISRPFRSGRTRVGLRLLASHLAVLAAGLGVGAWVAMRAEVPQTAAVPAAAVGTATPVPIGTRNSLVPPSVGTPVRAAPATTPAATPPGAKVPVATSPLRAIFQRGVLRLANAGGTTMPGASLTLFGADGSRHLARLVEPLAAGEEVFLGAEAFTPPLAAGFVPRRAEAEVDGAGVGARPVELSGEVQ